MQISVQGAKPNLGIEPAPHLHSKMSTRRLMLYVLASLVPALGVMVYFFGAGVLVQLVLAIVTALVCQVLAAVLRGRSIKRALQDPSGVVTAALLAMTLPPLLPWYFTVVATAFAMLLVRECFGGLGMNLFNPAMSGFIFLVVSAPSIFYSTWISPTPAAITIAGPTQVINVIFKGGDPYVVIDAIKDLNKTQEEEYSKELVAKAQAQIEQATADSSEANADATSIVSVVNTELPLLEAQEPHVTADALTGATFLESIKTARKAGNVDSQVKVDFLSPSFIAYVYLAGAYLLGGLILIATHVIRVQVPLAFIATLAAVGAIWHTLDPSMSISALEHLLMGGTMLGAFYIITDPVTTCGTFKGRILLSMIIAILIVVIRVHGSYSDSVAFAVMLGNCLAPLMDVLTKRRPFGIGYRHGGLD